MACCGGSDSALILAGQGIVVEGTGSPGSPYIIALESGQVSLNVADTNTVDMQIVGDGTGDNPFILSANATISMDDITNVDGSTAPVLGDVVLYDGTHWVYGPPPTLPPGSVNTTGGIVGDGTVGTPIKVNVANLVVTSTSGLASYIDTAGKVRVIPPTWDEVTGKPTEFDAATIDGRHLFVQASDPIASAVEGDLWFEEI